MKRSTPRTPRQTVLESLEPRLLLSAGPADWFEQWPDFDEFSPNSIIDMSYMLDGTAGEHGWLNIDAEGNFVFEDGTPVKFWGAVAGETSGDSVQQAKFYAKHGINMIRQHPVEGRLGRLQYDSQSGTWGFDPAKLDAWDQWFATLKNEGIYMTWSIFYHHIVMPSDRVSEGGMIPDELYNELPDSSGGKDVYGHATYIEEYQDHQWLYAETLLNHVNPYTGLAYKDDPGLAIVEARNEDSVFFHNPLNTVAGSTVPNHTARMKEGWQQWLLDKYGDDTALAEAWGDGMRSGDSVHNTNMGIYGAWEMEASGPAAKPDEKARMGDFIEYLAYMQRETYETYQSRLRSIGFGGVTISTAWKAGGPAADAANLWTDDAMDAISRHGYFGGGAGGHGISPGYVNNDSHMTSPGGGLLSAGLFQVEDKAFVRTEWTQKPPNQWKFEAAPMMAFYGMGLQGWDASYQFAGSRNMMGLGWPSNSSYVTETPHYIGQFPALSFAVYNGHFAEGDAAAARRIPLDEIYQGIDALTQPYPGSGFEPGGTYHVPNQVLAIGRVSNKFGDDLDDSYAQDWNAYWNQSRQVVHSNTGQLTWDYADKVILAHSDKTQGLIGFAQDGTYDLGGVVISDIDTEAMSLLFTPLDNEPLVESQHILVTALAQDRQKNSLYNEDGTELLQLGHSPLELEPVQATLSFRGGPITSVKVVDMYGVPTTQWVTRNGNQFRIDGTYETYYYEVKRSFQTPPVAEMPAAAGPEFDASEYTFEIVYTDDAGVNVSTLDSSDLQVTGPNGYSEMATFISVDEPTNGSPRVATYSIPAPGGTWGEADLGTYLVTVQSTQVANVSGQYTPYGTIGFFEFVDAPTATLDAAPPAQGSLRAYFDVTYTDDDGVKVNTLDNYDIRVTGPNDYDQLAVRHSIDDNSDGSPRTVTYYVPAPGGTWDTGDDGTYTFDLRADQVGDVNFNFTPAQTLGSFEFDATRPEVVEVLLNGGEAYPSQLNTLGLVFSEDVSASVDDADLQIWDVDAGAFLDLTGATVSYDAQSDTATWDLASLGIGAGSYQAAVAETDIEDPAGNLLQGTTTGWYVAPFEIVSGLVGDFNDNGELDVGDLNDLFAEINAGTHDPAYDLTGDGQVTATDADEWIRVIYGTEYGDANLDRKVDAADLSLLAGNWQSNGKLWQDANFNGDPAGDVDAADLSLLAGNWQWEAPAAAAPLAASSYERDEAPSEAPVVTSAPESDAPQSAPALRADPVVAATPVVRGPSVTDASVRIAAHTDRFRRRVAADADSILTADALRPIDLEVM